MTDAIDSEHQGATTEVNQGVGQDALLVHQDFVNGHTLERAFDSSMKPLAESSSQAEPGFALVRCTSLSESTQQSIKAALPSYSIGEYLYGFEKPTAASVDPAKRIEVTAQWTCHEETDELFDALEYWWRRVGTEAYTLEAGLVRFEVYKVKGQRALIIHETFEDTKVLQFHLQKGTAEKYKKDIDKVAYPECYYFRGPVSWLIRTYGKFLKLPGTFSNVPR